MAQARCTLQMTQVSGAELTFHYIVVAFRCGSPMRVLLPFFRTTDLGVAMDGCDVPRCCCASWRTLVVQWLWHIFMV